LRGQRIGERGRKLCNECVKVDIKRLGFVKEDVRNEDRWRSLTTGNRPRCLTAVMKMWSFTDCVLVSLSVDDNIYNFYYDTC